jgi:predicted DNA-binding WGR domain protein
MNPGDRSSDNAESLWKDRGFDMDNLLTIVFEAHNAEDNHHRRYQVTIGRDLLKDWTVAICYGRTGQGGRELRYAAAEADEMRAVIRDRLRRRLSAPRRIGCPYHLVAFNAAPGFEASAWLPGDIMARFFQPG